MYAGCYCRKGLGNSFEDCSSQPEEPILRLQMKPPGLEASITQNPGRDSEFCRITSQNHEQPLSKLVPRKLGEQSSGGSRSTKLVAGGHEMQSQNRNQHPGPNVKAMVQRVESLTRSAAQNDHLVSQASQFIQGLSVPLSTDHLMQRSSMRAGLTSQDDPVDDHVAQKQNERKVMVPEPSRPPKPVEFTASFVTGMDKKPSKQLVVRQTLVDQRSSEIKVSSGLYNDRNVRMKRGAHNMMDSRNEVLPRHRESQESSSSSRLDSSWTTEKIFHGKNKHTGEVEKPRKSTVTRVTRRNQVGQFHGLVQGLLRYIRHSKKAKPSRVGGVRTVRCSPHDRNKKLHWWKMLSRQGGVKLPNKHVKLRFVSKKPQLKMG
ncbi:Serine-rich adhesin for platelets [Quillaja saponaria]|uniref:Serine-rich adhesin for platelets n=1 Tax=Quillaja saponaria TaxID=32244 RepID=A0AAD7KST8_QUISA|nr:Serine-rich adhesin for platelets [Quillaja saponaria]